MSCCCLGGEVGWDRGEEGTKLSRGNYEDNDDEGNINPCVPCLCGVFYVLRSING